MSQNNALINSSGVIATSNFQGGASSTESPDLEGPDVGALEPLERPPDPLQPPLMVLRGNGQIFSGPPCPNRRGTDVDVDVDGYGYLEVEGLAGALEVDLDEEEAFVVLAEDGLEEAAAADEVEQHEVVGGGQVVQVVLRRRRLRRPRDLVPHLRGAPLPLLSPPPRRRGSGGSARRGGVRGFCFWARVPRRGVAWGGGDRVWEWDAG